ncbi:MAG TPA: HEAT repeat domain-containing protein [Vicinamibacterales bacterium]|nr:HEAT repeat domain-containing protein [Vicinamibacterales bacterium]
MPSSATEPMSVEQATALAEFARACKGAARAVSLYPDTHPAIASSLARVTSTGARLVNGTDVTLTVHPEMIVIDGRSAARPDAVLAELAGLLHDRLVGELRIERDATATDWHAFLLLLSRPREELLAEGGISQAWTKTGREHFSIREIDYAEVLRERSGGTAAEWDRIVASCLAGDTASLDERQVATLIAAVSDPKQFQELFDRLREAAGADAQTISVSAGALLQMMRGAMAANAMPSEDANRAIDGAIAGFVAASVTAERGATERLAQAFEALVPDDDQKGRLLDLAHDQAQQTGIGQEAGFEELWQGAQNMLLSYSDTNYVSDEYARELSTARRQAIDVERVSDDPPERIQTWLASVSDAALRDLDLALLRDLLRVEANPEKWSGIAAVVVREIERRTLTDEAEAAASLAELLATEARPHGRAGLAPEAGKALERLATGALARSVVLQLRKVEDSAVQPLVRLCHAVGPVMVRPLAEALAVEENSKAIRRLRELLLGFGAAGRQSVEQLKTSSNPAVRRTAIDLLRVFGGSEALPELASMLSDSDPQVQRESIRAIVQIGTADAHAVLQRALLAGGDARQTLIKELIDLRDERAIPVLCYAIDHTRPRGRLAQMHADIIDALGGLHAHADSLRTLRRVLYAGEWWAPVRTAALRRAASDALRRIGTREAAAILQEAAAKGSRGVRNAARVNAAAATRRERT